MEKFYYKICTSHNITNVNYNIDNIKKNIDDIIFSIEYDFEKLTTISSESGFKKTYLGIFSKDFCIPSGINMYEYIFPNEEFARTLETSHIIPVVDRLRKFFYPFEVFVEERGDIFLIFISWEHYMEPN